MRGGAPPPHALPASHPLHTLTPPPPPHTPHPPPPQYCLNLSAPFICEVPPFKKALTDLLPLVDYLFGNENEARAFAKSEGWETEDVEDIAQRVRGLAGVGGTLAIGA